METGIIERIYDIDWGVTEKLVVEGFTRGVVERTGGAVGDHTLATIQAQLEALNLVVEFVREARELTGGFIKELHASVTRTQSTYTATDALGRTVEAPLSRGDWKKLPNHVLRSDGKLFEYAPPEQVASEIENFAGMAGELARSHANPITQAAWLHHGFVRIHPFEDGNGRVARALTLLVMQANRYAPLVVDRFHRDDYLKALDSANDGELLL